VLRLDTLADQSKVHKACHLHPGRRREAGCVLTREHTGKLRYMRMRMLVQVAKKTLEDAGVESARGARPRVW